MKIKHFIIKGKRILYPLFFVLLTSIIGLNVIKIASPVRPLKVVTYRTGNGWGYHIEYQEKIIINQSFIPLIQGKHAFPDRKSARKTGTIMAMRLKKKQRPLITMKDLEELGISNE